MTRLREEVAVEVNLSLSATELDRRKYRQQFSQIYFCRLKQLMSSLRLAAQSKWLSSGMQEAIIVDRIIDLRPNQRSIIFGTIFVSLPNKPNVLKDLNGEVKTPNQHSYIYSFLSPHWRLH